MTEWQMTTETRLRAPILDVSHQFGLDLDLCEKSSDWAGKWKKLVDRHRYFDADLRSVLLMTKEEALLASPSIPRDENGLPSFRAEFAAQRLLYRISPQGATEYRDALEGTGLRVIPHFDRLDEIVGALLEARANNEFPYTLDAAMLPQSERNLPPEMPRGGQEHANFLWAVCYYMRGGIVSATAVKSLSRVYTQEPSLFDPHNAQYDDPERITELLKANGLSFSAEFVGKAWVENAKRMVERIDGDPRRLFDGTTSYGEILARIKNTGRGRGFLGFREKMTSMITYYLMDAGIIPYFDFPLPVDFHVLRLSASNEIVTFENIPESGNILSEKTLEMLRNMYHDYSVTHGVSQLDVCNAVWSYSSAICGIQPGNIMREPGRKEGRQGRSTNIVPLEIDTSSPAQITAYQRSCGMCQLEKTCKHNIPSKLYYVRGVAIPSERISFEEVDKGLFAKEALRVMTRGIQPERPERTSMQKKTAPKLEDEPLF